MVGDQKPKAVLVTGGAGYIGSTVCSALDDAGYIPIILDSLFAGSEAFTNKHRFYKGDISNKGLLDTIFKENGQIDFAVHCAARIIVPESVSLPEVYYRENVSKSLELFSALNSLGCKRIVFSSSAAIYGSSDGKMVREDSQISPSSPYSRTKYMMEQILEDLCNASDLRAIALRYFNPIGADPKFRTGPYAKNPTHLLGRLIATAKAPQQVFEITGNNWPTRDGTGIRDYIHVWDLALAHVAAIQKFESVFKASNSSTHSFRAINLGTGKGVTVREFVNAFEDVHRKSINKIDAPARLGDVAGSYANSDTAKDLLGWSASKSINEGIRDALEWSTEHAPRILGS